MRAQVDIGQWRVGVSDDVSTYAVESRGRSVHRLLDAEDTGITQPTGLVVELLHQISGVRPHALLAGTFEPISGDQLRLDVVTGGPFDLDGSRISSPLGIPVSLGLPPELAEAAAEGFLAAPATARFPAGRVRIVGGAIDHDSSPIAFRRCGALLREALLGSALSGDPQPAIERLIQAW